MTFHWANIIFRENGRWSRKNKNLIVCSNWQRRASCSSTNAQHACCLAELFNSLWVYINLIKSSFQCHICRSARLLFNGVVTTMWQYIDGIPSGFKQKIYSLCWAQYFKPFRFIFFNFHLSVHLLLDQSSFWWVFVFTVIARLWLTSYEKIMCIWRIILSHSAKTLATFNHFLGKV